MRSSCCNRHFARFCGVYLLLIAVSFGLALALFGVLHYFYRWHEYLAINAHVASIFYVIIAYGGTLWYLRRAMREWRERSAVERSERDELQETQHQQQQREQSQQQQEQESLPHENNLEAEERLLSYQNQPGPSQQNNITSYQLASVSNTNQLASVTTANQTSPTTGCERCAEMTSLAMLNLSVQVIIFATVIWIGVMYEPAVTGETAKFRIMLVSGIIILVIGSGVVYFWVQLHVKRWVTGKQQQTGERRTASDHAESGLAAATQE